MKTRRTTLALLLAAVLLAVLPAAAQADFIWLGQTASSGQLALRANVSSIFCDFDAAPVAVVHPSFMAATMTELEASADSEAGTWMLPDGRELLVLTADYVIGQGEAIVAPLPPGEGAGEGVDAAPVADGDGGGELPVADVSEIIVVPLPETCFATLERFKCEAVSCNNTCVDSKPGEPEASRKWKGPEDDFCICKPTGIQADKCKQRTSKKVECSWEDWSRYNCTGVKYAEGTSKFITCEK